MATDSWQTCTSCNQKKPITSYYVNPRSGVMRKCKTCVKEYQKDRYHAVKHQPEWKRTEADRRMRNRYGIGLETFELLMAQQAEKCAICESTLRKPFVDHDHSTGKVRGILCPRCNTLVGYIETTPDEVMDKVRGYLNGN